MVKENVRVIKLSTKRELRGTKLQVWPCQVHRRSTKVGSSKHVHEVRSMKSAINQQLTTAINYHRQLSFTSVPFYKHILQPM